MKKLIVLATSLHFCLNPINAINPGKEIASDYSITVNKPAPGFFEGALLGNGGMGVVVTTRPDALVFHFGHNNVWDIRINESNTDKFGTFDEVFSRAKAVPDSLNSIQDDKWFADYLWMTADNYRSPYPRPFPCGSLLLGFDRRSTEVTGHNLNIADGICSISLISDGRPLTLDVFTDMSSDRLWMALHDDIGNTMPSCFNRMRVIPDPSTPADIPSYTILTQGNNTIGFMQKLPNKISGEPSDADKAFALKIASATPLQTGWHTSIMGGKRPMENMERELVSTDTPFIVCATLSEGIATTVEKEAEAKLPLPTPADYALSKTQSEAEWERYWAASSIKLDDKDLEAIWYRNLYFYNCAVKPGVTCPGIFANWSYSNIGTAWHGDYHLNYNTQQPFWLSFSSNHIDKNLAYVDLVEKLLPVSRKWASEYYGMRGAFFPHSAYPVEMTTHPYPVPDWGWEVFETPWMVQGLWWHYLYTGDKNFLRKKAFTPIKDAVMFLVDYMSRPEAHGKQWNDNKYHIFPSVPPELYGLQPGFKFNYDTQIDITLSKQIFNAYLQAIDILGIRKDEKKLAANVTRILKAMPNYPTAKSEKFGTILTSVPGEGEGIVYNVPANLTVVFPGNEYGLSSPDSIKQIVGATIKAHRNEGGNEIVFLNMQKARMGMLDLEVFKRHVNYATLPNQTITDAVTETGGRYSDVTDYMYMAPMGIWFENFAIAGVINECLMQSHEDAIRLFPNWDINHPASFNTLRAMGAFLVSASADNGTVQYIEITSEQGNRCKIYNPWPNSSVTLANAGKVSTIKEINGIIEFDTKPGQNYLLTKHDHDQRNS